MEWRKTLFFVRYVLPALIIVGGLIPIAIDPSGDNLEGGLGVIGAGIAVGLLNLLYRSGVSGEVHAQREEEARRFFDAHGHWPDEETPARERGGSRTGHRPFGPTP